MLISLDLHLNFFRVSSSTIWRWKNVK